MWPFPDILGNVVFLMVQKQKLFTKDYILRENGSYLEISSGYSRAVAPITTAVVTDYESLRQTKHQHG